MTKEHCGRYHKTHFQKNCGEDIKHRKAKSTHIWHDYLILNRPDLIARILQVDITQLNRKFELEASELPELNDSDVEFMSASKAFPKKDYDEQVFIFDIN